MAPVLLPAAALVYAYTSIPTFKEARRVFVDEKRIGVDALDAVVMIGCFGTMSIFPGAVCCWCLSFGRSLVKRSRERSQTLLQKCARQAAQARMALSRRSRGSGFDRPARKRGCRSSSTPAKWSRWTDT